MSGAGLRPAPLIIPSREHEARCRASCVNSLRRGKPCPTGPVNCKIQKNYL